MKDFWKNLFLVQPQASPAWSRGRRAVYYAWRWGLLLCAGICMGLALLVLAIGPYPKEVLFGYFRFAGILVLNTVPVVLLIFLFYGVTGNAWSAFLLGGGVAFAFSMGNYYKLQFRDDPLYFEDMLILHEAKAMATGDHYQLFLDKRIAAVLFCLILGVVLLRVLVPGKSRDWRGRAVVAAGAVLIAAAVSPVYLDQPRYNAIKNYDHLNHWSATQDYLSRGFIYPFFHSVTDFIETPPAGYKTGSTKALLASYPDASIPEDKKISVIGLMREAYVDFSRYDIDGLDVSGYGLYHALEAESYTGNLVTNIFAGGTVDTERCFLTGNYQLRNFRGNANSYVWYFRDQGYTTEGSHPYYQWFYNRLNINGYLGFQSYRFLEDDFEHLTKARYPEDKFLMPEIYSDFKAATAAGAPCFSFSVNVQSHGPYETGSESKDGSWLAGDYTDECKNAMNHYLAAIWETDEQLIWLVDQLRNDPEPVVLVTFGDHLPWMGGGNEYYQEMGVDVDAGTDEDFYTRYSTRYLIWANSAAKEIIGHDVQGEGPDISPCYLMNLVFSQLGWEGPSFMQAMDEMMEVFPIATTTGRIMTDGVLSGEVPAERQDLYHKFQYLQHYWRTEFLYQHLLK